MLFLKTKDGDYKDNINNPLILGYYCHLLVDNYYNNIYIWVDCDYDTGVITDYSYEYEGSPF